MLLQKSVERHFYAVHGSETTLVFLPTGGEAFWSLYSSLIQLLSLSGRIGQTEKNLFKYIEGELSRLRKPNRINININ